MHRIILRSSAVEVRELVLSSEDSGHIYECHTLDARKTSSWKGE